MTESERYKAEAFATGVLAKSLALSGLPIALIGAILTEEKLYTQLNGYPLWLTGNNELLAHQIVSWSPVITMVSAFVAGVGIKLNGRAARIRALSKTTEGASSSYEIL